MSMNRSVSASLQTSDYLNNTATTNPGRRYISDNFDALHKYLPITSQMTDASSNRTGDKA